MHSVGRMREAREQIERARQLDPSSSIMNTLVQIDLFMTREFDKSIEQGHKVLQHAPSWELARSFLAYAYLQTGRTAPALQVVDAAPSRLNSLQVVRAHVLAASGDGAAARRTLSDAEGRFAVEPVPRGYLAAAHLALGDTDRAIGWLAKAVEERDQSINAMKTNPLWDAIRSDPRFVALLKRMNLE